jgi:hypothetical protein
MKETSSQTAQLGIALCQSSELIRASGTRSLCIKCEGVKTASPGRFKLCLEFPTLQGHDRELYPPTLITRDLKTDYTLLTKLGIKVQSRLQGNTDRVSAPSVSTQCSLVERVPH